MKRAFLVISAIILTACSATGPHFTGATAPSANKALIYVYRPTAVIGSAGALTLKINGQEVAELLNSGYKVIEVEPGHVDLNASWGGQVAPITISVDAVAGKRYYARYGSGLGPSAYTKSFYMVNMNFQFGFVNEDVALKELPDTRYSE